MMDHRIEFGDLSLVQNVVIGIIFCLFDWTFRFFLELIDLLLELVSIFRLLLQ